ncbi:GNAT family N-acetyltransferase [Qipengyuania sp.]|uniref:GNAT family N-acetyltransferase n=1 Tax=Qipengyuania sp. TaxID=2004515 RepID=UPI0035187048
MHAFIRPLKAIDLDEASALCLRSKAHWGYDAKFMEACRSELVFTPRDIEEDLSVGLWVSGSLRAVAQISGERERWELEKLFVEPAAMGRGLGRTLFEWAVVTVASRGGTIMTIAADPCAVPFYRRMGAEDAGHVPSGSIRGRFLPRLHLRVGRKA